MGNGGLFYFNDDGKMELSFIQKKCTLRIKQSSVILIECTKLNWNGKYTNILCVPILSKDTGWSWGLIVIS